MMSTLTFARAAVLAAGVTLFTGAGGSAALLPTNVAAMKSLASQSATEVRWGGVGWRGGGWGSRGWGWGAAATGALVGGYFGGGYYSGGYPSYGDASYPLEDDEESVPYDGYRRGGCGW
jgi:hypothetical protein